MIKIKKILLTGCVAALISGCGLVQPGVDTTTVSFEKDGEIKQIIVEDFAESYYDTEELKSDIQAEVASYNQAAGAEDAVVLEDVSLSDEKVITVEMQFKGYADYQAFNERELFWGTVAQAYSAGYEFTSMRDVNQEGVVLSSSDVLEKGEMHMVILEEAQQLIVPGNILFISDGVSVVDADRAVNLNEGQKAFVIYE